MSVESSSEEHGYHQIDLESLRVLSLNEFMSHFELNEKIVEILQSESITDVSMLLECDTYDLIAITKLFSKEKDITIKDKIKFRQQMKLIIEQVETQAQKKVDDSMTTQRILILSANERDILSNIYCKLDKIGSHIKIIEEYINTTEKLGETRLMEIENYYNEIIELIKQRKDEMIEKYQETSNNKLAHYQEILTKWQDFAKLTQEEICLIEKHVFLNECNQSIDGDGTSLRQCIVSQNDRQTKLKESLSKLNNYETRNNFDQIHLQQPAIKFIKTPQFEAKIGEWGKIEDLNVEKEEAKREDDVAIKRDNINSNIEIEKQDEAEEKEKEKEDGKDELDNDDECMNNRDFLNLKYEFEFGKTMFRYIQEENPYNIAYTKSVREKREKTEEILIFDSGIDFRASRFDDKHENGGSGWKKRGSGPLRLFYDVKFQIIRLEFVDGGYNKVRLDQIFYPYSDFEIRIGDTCKYGDAVEWYNSDYVMPTVVTGKWRITIDPNFEDKQVDKAVVDLKLQEFFQIIKSFYYGQGLPEFIKNGKKLQLDSIIPDGWKNENHEEKAEKEKEKAESKDGDGNDGNDGNSSIFMFNMNENDSFDEYSGFGNFGKQFSKELGEYFGNLNGFGENNQEDSKSRELCLKSSDDNFDDFDGMLYNLRPIIHVEKHQVPCGHENEIEVGHAQFKTLYRFGPDVGGVDIWKQRANSSTLYFYQSQISGKVRMVVRDRKNFKLRLNHYVPVPQDGDIDFQLQNISSKINNANGNGNGNGNVKLGFYTWVAVDQSIIQEEEKTKLTIFGIKFSDKREEETFAYCFSCYSKTNE